MVINKLNLIGSLIRPFEANSVLIIYPNTILAFTISCQSLELISRGNLWTKGLKFSTSQIGITYENPYFQKVRKPRLFRGKAIGMIKCVHPYGQGFIAVIIALRFKSSQLMQISICVRNYISLVSHSCCWIDIHSKPAITEKNHRLMMTLPVQNKSLLLFA